MGMLVWEKDSGRDEDIVLTQTDIRQLQLAKGAIVSGVVMLQTVNDVTDEALCRTDALWRVRELYKY